MISVSIVGSRNVSPLQRGILTDPFVQNKLKALYDIYIKKYIKLSTVKYEERELLHVWEKVSPFNIWTDV